MGNDVFVYIIVLLVIDAIIVTVYFKYSHYIVSIAQCVPDIETFCTNLSAMRPYLINVFTVISGGYVVYSIVVRNDGVNKYIGIDGMPSMTSGKYIKVPKEHKKRVAELVKHVDNVTF